MLVSLCADGGLAMLTAVWILAVVGLLLDVFVPERIECLQILICLVMGWLCTLNYAELQAAIPAAGVFWLTLGGIAYTTGIIFYVLDNLKKLSRAHGIWHLAFGIWHLFVCLFVLLGSISHFISIAGYVR
jgi:hemolysin III